MATFKEYWTQWIWRDVTARLITVNSIVWLLISVGLLVMGQEMSSYWIGLFALPASISMLPWRFWTVATYMFSQHDFLHLLVNMLWLMLFGRMIEHALGGKRLIKIYVYGGIAGAAAFLLSNLVVPGPFPYMIGASCAVLSVTGAAAVIMPKWRIPLLVFGDIKVVWIAVAAIVLFIVLEPSAYVSIAHGAGLATGLLYGVVKSKGGLKRVLGLRKLKMPLASADIQSALFGSDEENLDALLDKVSRSGYNSLSAKERQRLFDLSQKIKK